VSKRRRGVLGEPDGVGDSGLCDRRKYISLLQSSGKTEMERKKKERERKRERVQEM